MNREIGTNAINRDECNSDKDRDRCENREVCENRDEYKNKK